MIDLYIYSDESGVFDKEHYDHFIFGGIVFLSRIDKDIQARSFISIEKRIKTLLKIKGEMKASKLDNKIKYNLYRSFNKGYKFCTLINQKDVYDEIYNDKKTKQRFLDYAFKMGLRNCLTNLISSDIIKEKDVRNIYVYCDSHTTSTNGRYELQESLEEEFKRGIFSNDFRVFHEPLFKTMNKVEVKYLESSRSPLIRVSDIISNYLYNKVRNKKEITSCFVKKIP